MSQSFVIAERLALVMEKRGINLERLAELLYPTPRGKIKRWIDGHPASTETIERIGVRVGIDPQELTGFPLPTSEYKPCGMAKLMEILNEDGGDYLGESGPMAITKYRGEFVGALNLHRGMSDQSDKCSGGY